MSTVSKVSGLLEFENPAEEEAYQRHKWEVSSPFLKKAAIAAVFVWPAFTLFDYLVAPAVFSQLAVIRVVVAFIFLVLAWMAMKGPRQYAICMSLACQSAFVGLLAGMALMDFQAAMIYFTGLMIAIFAAPILFHVPFRMAAVNTLAALVLYLIFPLTRHVPAEIIAGHYMYILTFGGFSLFGVWLFESSHRAAYLASREVAQNEERLRAMLSHGADFVAVMQPDGKFTYVSDSVINVTGFTAEEFLREGRSLVHPEDMNIVMNITREIMSHPNVPMYVDFRHKKKDGGYFILSGVGINMMDNPAVRGIILNNRDMTERKEFERSLAESEERLQAMLSHGADFVAVMQPDGKFTYVGDSVINITGFTAGEYLHIARSLVHPEDLDKVIQANQRMVNNPGTPVTVDFRHRKKDGTYFIVSSVGINMMDNPAVRGFLLNNRDVTERKNFERSLAESEERFRTLVENTSAILATMSPGGDLSYIAPSWTTMLGRDPQEDTGGNFGKWVHQDDLPGVAKAIELVKNGEASTVDVEHRMSHADGSWRWLSSKFRPVFGDNGETVSINGVAHDITALKQTQEALTAARDRAEQATRLKDKFVALVSHDLRSPLASIAGMLGLMDEEKIVEGEAARLVRNMKSSVTALLELIRELLSLSRLKTGQMTPLKSNINARSIAGEALSTCSPLAERKGINLVNLIPEGSSLFGDKTLVREMLVNLVTNAIKFTNSGGTAAISLPSPLTLRVEDNGVGIRPDFLPNLFSGDVKTTSLGTAGERGTGLGLPYCHEIAKAHGGDLTVESEPGKGAVFTFTLPSHGMVILLVDDQEAHRNIMKQMLKDVADADYLEAENGAQAMEALQGCVPDLIITDIAMPEMDGFALLRHIRGLKAMGSVPVLVVSSFQSSPDFSGNIQERVAQAGGNGFVQKPLIREEFLSTAQKLLAGRKK